MMLPGFLRENLFDDFFDDFSKPLANFGRTGGFSSQAVVMKTDIKEMENGYELNIELPGVKKENVQVELKDGYLTVNAAHGSSSEDKDEKGKYLRRERYYGTASRSFYVGEQIKQEDIKARFENGILKLTFPKVNPQEAVEEKKYIAIEG